MDEKGETGKIRSFIAIEINNAAREEMGRVISIFKKSSADVKWVDPGSVHMTLKFLGSITESDVRKISGRLKEISSDFRSFQITTGQLGAFPGWASARVLWIGIERGAEEIKALASRVEGALSQEGFEKEKRAFAPHLTFGRVKQIKVKDEFRKIADSVTVNHVDIDISRIVLFKSVLSPRGAEYTPLVEFNLSR